MDHSPLNALLLTTVPFLAAGLGLAASFAPLEPFAARATAPEPLAGGDWEEAGLAAAEFWAEWAASQLLEDDLEKRYLPLDLEDSRVVIWYPKGAKTSKLKGSTKKTVAAFDKLFPPKTREANAPERRCAVLFPIAGPKTFRSLTAFISEKVPRLSVWAQTAPTGVGFLLEEPLAAGWREEVPSSEVWNPENEQVNRLARLLLIERYGRLPHWLGQGLAWELELTVCKDVYCFPFRSGFVSKKEHKSWPTRLTRVMAERGEEPLTIAELSSWPRSSWDEERAVLSWGAAAMLAKHYQKELPQLLATHAEVRSKEGRKTEADGSWQWIPDYETAAEKQLEILNQVLGVDFEAELTRYAKKPNTYRRPR